MNLDKADSGPRTTPAIADAGALPPFGASWMPIYAGVLGLLLTEIALFWVITQVYA